MSITLTQIAARQHLDDLRRESEQARRLATAPARRRSQRLPRLFPRRAPRVAAA